MHLPRQASPPILVLPREFPAENQGTRIIMITAAITGVSFLVVSLRVYVRAVMLKNVESDDYTMMVAMLFAAGVFVCFVEEVKQGVGHNLDPVLAANSPRVGEWLWIQALFNIVAQFFIKTSVGLFLLRLVQGKGYKRSIISMMVFLFFFTLACLCSFIFQCLPVKAIWEQELQPPFGNARCYSISVGRSLGIFNGSINVFTDVLFASLPIPVILTLQINVRTKATLIAILSIGYFACIASVIRTVLQANVFYDSDSTFNDTYVIWTAVETNVGILAASLPALRPLFAWVLDTASNITFRTTRSRRQKTKDLYFGQASIRLSSINSGDQPIRKERVIRGPVSRLEQSIGVLENQSEEYIIGRSTDQRA
ncbi:hypothetical protein NA56DRAFT_699435 [Hyaloscypha hepaticicola]|uniref:Rhodopsin domain-containing protein n=1 Tax=Hyaloscypha hepaticicola TaxID=2082293 RepID=A0A2J6QGY8_9HELO|nr:hypothetical protein NA56DRAFT_699435 [Hyaloscypha hepaticicola]